MPHAVNCWPLILEASVQSHVSSWETFVDELALDRFFSKYFSFSQ